MKSNRSKTRNKSLSELKEVEMALAELKKMTEKCRLEFNVAKVTQKKGVSKR